MTSTLKALSLPLIAAASLLVAPACSAPVGGGSASSEETAGRKDQRRYVERGLDAADRSVRDPDGSLRRSAQQRAPVIVQGNPVGWSALLPFLAEAAGADIVDEYALDMLLQAECRRASVTITSADLEAEQDLLIETLTGTGRLASTPEQIEQLVMRVRAQRGLGPQRWRALLDRNARLRALVRDAVSVSDDAVDRMHQRLYGPDFPARLIVTPTAQQASEAIRRLRNGETFGVVAAELSTDPSADRGGIIPPINVTDPTWPQAIRQAVEVMQVNDVSDPIFIDEGYAVLWLERPPAPKHVPSVSAVRADLARLVRLEQERLLMQREARRILDEADIGVLDQSLDWARKSRSR